MNRNIFILIIVVISEAIFCPAAKAQQTLSFIKQDEIKVQGVTTSNQVDALGTGSMQTTRLYSDGLGRTLQTVIIKGSPTQNDVIQPVVYDNQGNTPVTYLPYTISNDGSYRPNALGTSSEQAAFYNTASKVAHDIDPYSQQVFENSPLRRVLRVGATGNGFQTNQHYKTINYRSNTTADNVVLWNTTGVNSGYYTAGMLQVTDGIDEDGAETILFKDNNGKQILKRQLSNATTGTFIDTYNIYNEIGELTYVVQPRAVALMQQSGNWSLTQTAVANLIFSYVYDSLGREIQKTLPGGISTYIIYDPLNRPVLIQDNNLRANNQWNYIKYDAKWRAISQGIYTDATHTGQAAMQSYVNGLNYSTTYFEGRSTSSASGYYTNNVFPATNITPLAYSYFDNYDVDDNGTADYSYQTAGLTGESAVAVNTSGLPTVLRTRSIGQGLSNIWLTKAMFYDDKGGMIQVQGNNQLNTAMSDIKTTVVDFTEHPLQVNEVKVVNSVTTSILTTYSYDNMYRLTALDQSYNGGTSNRVATYEYNELGQLVKKNLEQLGTASIPSDVSLASANSVASGSTSNITASNSITINSGFFAASGSVFTARIVHNYLQSVDYRYNINGQLTNINNSKLANDADVTNSDNNDLFGMQLMYELPDANITGATASYSGRLSAVKWMTRDENGNLTNERSYKYSYSILNQLTAANYAERAASGTVAFNVNQGGFDESGITCDENGNILTLNRNSSSLGAPAGAAVDNLTYTYNSTNPNQLQSLTDGSGSGYTGYGFRNITGSTANYTYAADNSGNLANDPYKGLSLGYNVLNKTDQITIPVTGNAGRFIRYTYNADGQLLRKQQYDNNTLQTQTDYIDGFVYIGGVLSYFNMPEGRVLNVGGTLKQEFIIADQQGNARVSFTDNGGGVAFISQEDSYYPYGLVMAGGVIPNPTTPNTHLYNGGSDWQNDYNNLPDYYQTFYRNYDAALGRFISADPEAEASGSLGGYHYAGNNPLMYNDPMGNIDGNPDEEITPGRDESFNCAICAAAGYVPATGVGFNGSDLWHNMELIDFTDPGAILQAAKSGNADAVKKYGELYGTTYTVTGTTTTQTKTSIELNSEKEYASLGGTGTNGTSWWLDVTETKTIINFTDNGDDANQGGPGPSWWQSVKDYFANVGTAAKMTAGWGLGVGDDSRVFMNDRVADAMRNSPGIAQARSDYYNKNKTSGTYTFGLKGLWQAGVNPIEQFVGSFSYSISYNQEGGFLQYTITNLTSLRSADYHITPTSWNISPGYPMGDFNQAFIFTEPLRH